MDRSLDEIIGERPRGGRGGGRGRGRGGRRPEDGRAPPPRAPRREEYPRDGINKQSRQEDRAAIDTDWVHDRFEDDRHDRRRRDSPEYSDRREALRGPSRRDRGPTEDATIRVENLHYELTEGEVTELFARIGPIATSRLLYDRRDRSQGIALVTYHDPRDAREAMREYNGANANGQPIRISLAPPAPTKPAGGGSLFDRVESRSLFERVGNGRDDRRGGRARSYSPRRQRDDIDQRRPERRGSPGVRGGPRERGRRPGARREESGRDGRRPRADDTGRPLVGARPKKTAEELDAEMADYFAAEAAEPATGNGTAGKDTATTTKTSNGAVADDDIDMIS